MSYSISYFSTICSSTNKRSCLKNGSATVTWDEPVFSDNIGVVKIEEKQGFRPGQTLLWGNYDIAYVAYDQAGNTAVCQFKVYVLGKLKC